MSKTRASCFIRGSKHLETIKSVSSVSRCLEPLMEHSHSFLTYHFKVSSAQEHLFANVDFRLRDTYP